jgi:hypothetical protein
MPLFKRLIKSGIVKEVFILIGSIIIIFPIAYLFSGSLNSSYHIYNALLIFIVITGINIATLNVFRRIEEKLFRGILNFLILFFVFSPIVFLVQSNINGLFKFMKTNLLNSYFFYSLIGMFTFILQIFVHMVTWKEERF